MACIYSAQGFEFNRVGVIWGQDLVWRDGSWISDRTKSRDNPVKRKDANTTRLLRNAYRVLLTRGRDGFVIFVPPEASMDETEHTLLASGIEVLPSASSQMIATA